MKKRILWLSLLLIAGITNAQNKLSEDLTCKQASKIIQKHSKDPDFVILDVRTPEEFRNGHITNALNIDYKDVNFQKKIKKLDIKKTYMVYCKVGIRSSNAISIMKTNGFVNLYHLYEGITIWEKEGYKIVTEQAGCSN